MTDDEYLNGLFADLDDQLSRFLGAAADSDEQHEAIDAAADVVYRLRQKVRARYPGKKAFYAAAAESPQGTVVEGITSLHGKHAHDFVRSLSWVRLDGDAVAEHLDDDQVSRYRAIAGRGVADTVRTAREYLWAATHSE